MMPQELEKGKKGGRYRKDREKGNGERDGEEARKDLNTVEKHTGEGFDNLGQPSNIEEGA